MIDLDEQTTAISYHSDKDSQVDPELHSLFSMNNKPTTTIHHQPADASPAIKHADRLKTVASPDDSCYYDALTASIQSSIFSDNFFEQIETLNQFNKIDPLAAKYMDASIGNDQDIYAGFSVENLTKIVQDIKESQSCIRHLVFAYDETLTDAVDSPIAGSTSDSTDGSCVEQPIESDTSIVNVDHYREMADDIDEDFEDLYERYITNLNQYEQMLQRLDASTQEQRKLLVANEQPSNEPAREPNSCFDAIFVKRQENHIGHYGFELGQAADGKITVSSVIDSHYCPHLHVGDEIMGLNGTSTLTRLEQYHLLLNSLWHHQYEDIQLLVRKATKPGTHIP